MTELANLIAMLRAVSIEEGCTVFNHSAEEIGLEVIVNDKAVLKRLAGSTSPAGEVGEPSELLKRLAAFVEAPDAKTFTIVKDGDQLLLNSWTVDLRAKQFERLAALTKPAVPDVRDERTIDALRVRLMGTDEAADNWTYAGMEDAFFRWPVVERELRQALAALTPQSPRACCEVERLRNLLALADDTLMESIGAFPLQGHPLRAACLAIRSETGDDYQERKRRAATAIRKGADQ